MGKKGNGFMTGGNQDRQMHHSKPARPKGKGEGAPVKPAQNARQLLKRCEKAGISQPGGGEGGDWGGLPLVP